MHHCTIRNRYFTLRTRKTVDTLDKNKYRSVKKTPRKLIMPILGSASFGLRTFYAASHPNDKCGANGLPLTPNSVKILGRFQVLQTLTHPNICHYLDISKTKHECMLVVSESYGRSLKDKIKTNAPISEIEIISIAYQILEGLNHIHQNGIVHRNLALDNVLLTDQGIVKLSEYGLYYMTDCGADVSFPIGLPRYLSPETVCSGPVKVDDETGLTVEPTSGPKSDLWSFGIILLELVMGKQLWADSNIQDILRNIIGFVKSDMAPLDILIQKIQLSKKMKYPELMLASYNVNEDAPNDPDGVALVWNLKYKNMAPEYIFHCQSSVMSTCFAKFNPNVVIGGTYSGRIVLWDNRVNKRTPVQRTPLSASSHTHPVYCVNVVGTQNAHNLISVSSDGKVCSWSLDNLSQPQDSMELQAKQSKPVAATCFSFLSGDANNFIVGSEECSVYSACRHGSKAGINESYEGHQGPITSIDTHKVPGQVDFSPYFLTSSFDWTIKLWSIKQPYYIHSFEDNSEYVYDVRWSPIHPALFASVDGEGKLDLWNLNSETEVPTASVLVDGRPALNQCRWHQTGHHISVGDNNGRIHIYDVGEHIANPKNDEWSRFVHTLQELKQHAAEREEDSSLAGSGAPLR